jgi:hypothetical protein
MVRPLTVEENGESLENSSPSSAALNPWFPGPQSRLSRRSLMKSFGMLKIPMILVGLGAALVLSPSCKAQEVSPEHFTDTGVQDVYESAARKVVAPKGQQKPPATQARMHLSSSTVEPVAKRAPVSAPQPSALAVADKRKALPSIPKKP